MDNPFKHACDLIGAANMARYLDVSPQAVYEWKKGKRPFPLDRVMDVERATEGQIDRKDLRPDDWQKHWPEFKPAEKKKHNRRKEDIRP
jgi:DNA-binding transcriptional regulator YdaS (Cro superfamily)